MFSAIKKLFGRSKSKHRPEHYTAPQPEVLAPTMKRSEPSLADLAPYAGRWVALVRERVAGVGWTDEEARREGIGGEAVCYVW